MSRKRYLIDSNICIMVLRNLYNAEEIFKLIKEEDCYISEITLYELWCGNEIAKLHKKGYREQKLERFLSYFKILPISEIVKIAAIEKARLQSLGLPLDDDFDLLIACTSVYHGMTMVTDNIRHFKNIRGIKIQDWVHR